MSWQRPLIALIVLTVTALLVVLLGSPPAPALANASPVRPAVAGSGR